MIKKIKWLLCSTCLTILACKDAGEPSLPLEENEIVSILCDIHIAEVAAQPLFGIQKDSMLEIYYQQIREIHGMDEATLHKTLTILKDDPFVMERIYTKVLDSLDKRKEGLRDVSKYRGKSGSESEDTPPDEEE